MLARLSVDLRMSIAAEGRLPDAVILVFPEPEAEDHVAVRVNEYNRDARLERVVKALAQATDSPDGPSV